ncbi:DNA translocase FtsK [Gluconobacter oxydans]|uniref:DNA translocase FtsK n=1 Tax=Gluconobacter oxydans TaxID=442 RepID=UPI0039E9887B
MNEIDIQSIMTSRFRTSLEADKQTVSLMEKLGLSTKAAVARLAIARSLSVNSALEISVDAKGNEIPGSILFSKDDAAVWVGLIITFERAQMNNAKFTMDIFRSRLRQHWHRGVALLCSDWQNSDQNFDGFVEMLVRRYTALPEYGSPQVGAESTIGLSLENVDQSEDLVNALSEMGIYVKSRGIVHGPRVTRYLVQLKDITQLGKLKRSLEQLSLSLNSQENPITLALGNGAKTVTIEIPRYRETWSMPGKEAFVSALRSHMTDEKFLVVSPGVDIVGEPVFFDLREAPHLLVGGATGQGKSVCIHSLLLSLISTHHSSSLRLALMDPKQVEFLPYEKCKFLWNDQVATGIESCAEMVASLVDEMERRYEIFAQSGISNIIDAEEKGLKIPYIVACIDETADLILQDRLIEQNIIRLAQKARAAGIHLILATQRPDAKTFSGLLRSNIPARIALTVQKSSESQIILDDSGAESLLGAGDMILKLPGKDPKRIHGYFLKISDVQELITHAK